MKIGLMTRKASLYSHKRIIETAEERGHSVVPIDALRCTLVMVTEGLKLLHRGDELPPPDVLIPRIGASITWTGVAVLRQLEIMGSRTISTPEAIANSRDKLTSQQMLAHAGLPVPAAVFLARRAPHADVTRYVGGVPAVVKALNSTHGDGVELVNTDEEVEDALDNYSSSHDNALVQQFIEEADGKDLRCFVVGGQVIAAMRREAADGEFRSNVHQGGEVYEANLSEREKEVAVAAAKVFGLGVAGVDLIRSKGGPLVLEVNSSPGLEGIEEATGVDVAGHIIDLIETNYGDLRAT